MGMMFRRLGTMRRQRMIARCHTMLHHMEERTRSETTDAMHDDDGMDARFAA